MDDPTPAPPRPERADDVGDSFRWAWSAFRAHWGTWVLLGGLVAALGWAVYFLGYVPVARAVTDDAVNAFGFQRHGAPPPDTVSQALRPLLLVPVAAGFSLVVNIVLAPVLSNVTRLGLMATDGKAVSPRDALRFPRGLLRTWALGLVLALGTSVGLLLCYLPGLVFATLTCFAWHVFYHQGLGPMASIRASVAIVRASPGVCIVALLVTAILAFLGVLACLVGTIVSGPLSQLFLAHRYRSITATPAP